MKIWRAWLAMSCALLALNANAVNLYCVGSVSHLFSRGNGELLFKASYRGDYVAVCNLQSAWNGIPPDQCKNWYATLLVAQLSGSVVSVAYQNSEGYASCSVVATYGSAPVPLYVMLGDTFQ